MVLFKLPLTFLLDFQVHILVEMDAVVGEIVMLSAQPDSKSVAIADLPIAPSFVDVVEMQTSVIADVKELPTEIAFFIRLHYRLHL